MPVRDGVNGSLPAMASLIALVVDTMSSDKVVTELRLWICSFHIFLNLNAHYLRRRCGFYVGDNRPNMRPFSIDDIIIRDRRMIDR